MKLSDLRKVCDILAKYGLEEEFIYVANDIIYFPSPDDLTDKDRLALNCMTGICAREDDDGIVGYC